MVHTNRRALNRGILGVSGNDIPRRAGDRGRKLLDQTNHQFIGIGFRNRNEVLRQRDQESPSNAGVVFGGITDRREHDLPGKAGDLVGEIGGQFGGLGDVCEEIEEEGGDGIEGEGLGPEGLGEGIGNGAEELDGDGLGPQIGGIGAFGEEACDGKDGIEVGARNPRRSRREVLRRRAFVAYPQELVGELRRVLRNQVA